MEKFVELLYNRLGDHEKAQLCVIVDNAINEMHNNGVLQKLSPEAYQRVHNSDPEIRVTEKTSLAKAVGYGYISEPGAIITSDGQLASQIQVDFNPVFTHAICLCIQGGLEGLYQSKIYKENKSNTMRYMIKVRNYDAVTDLFKSNIATLNQLYENFNLEIAPYEKAALA